MTEEDKANRRAYKRNWYSNLSEEKKNKIRDYTKSRYRTLIKKSEKDKNI